MALPNLNEINFKHGPYQIVHDFEFVALNLGKGDTEIRDMSEGEKYDYICARVKKLKDRGYGGIVINTDFKDYLEKSEDIDFCIKVIKYAHKPPERSFFSDILTALSKSKAPSVTGTATAYLSSE